MGRAEVNTASQARKPLSDTLQPRDGDAIGELLEQVTPDLWVFLRRHLSCEADIADTVQDVAVRAIRMSDPSPLFENPKGYLFRVALNLVRDKARRDTVRRRDRHQTLDDSPIACPALSPECMAASTDAVADIDRVLTQAGMRVREVVLLRCIYEFTHVEIARQLGVTVRTVERCMRRAREICQPIYSQEFGVSGESRGYQ